MLASKKYLVRLCLNLTAISVLAVVANFAIQATASASSSSIRTPSGATSSRGDPGGTCDATGNDGCNVTFSGTLTGSLGVTIGTATITPPTTLDGTAQSAPFTFTTNVADTRGPGVSPWSLSAASSGLTVSTIGGTTTNPFLITDVTAACATTASCSNDNIIGTTGTLTTTAEAYATAPSGGDLGTTVVTVTGNVPLGADTVGGAYNGTITITAGPTV